MGFLPTTRDEMIAEGWDRADFVLITGDAYIDHPSFGTAIISRVLKNLGFKVAILAQPNWRSPDDFRRFGKPKLGFLINGGNVDSMVNHYSVWKHRRNKDSYSPGGEAGLRPDRAVIVYSNRAREAFKDVPIIIGGLEASLRRLSHYDYWEDRVRRSVLLDSKADLLIYGMGERAVGEIAEALAAGINIVDITWIMGTCFSVKKDRLAEGERDTIYLPPYEEISKPEIYGKSFLLQYQNTDSIHGKRLVEEYPGGFYVVQNPPQRPLEPYELDAVYELPYERAFHPSYKEKGGVPALTEVEFSITANRGCFGGCSFCALTFHQGREVRGRSKESILREGKLLTEKKNFKGYIHDVGGPTANFRNPSCNKQLKSGVCKHKECLFPQPCKELRVDHREFLDILRSLRELPRVKKVFIRSGIRYDYLLADPECDDVLREICMNHVSGTLKVAPEHISKRVLKAMRKPSKEVFLKFSDKYKRINEALGLKQYLIPYIISSHPGSILEDGVELALFLKEYGFVADQIQDFYPTPGTGSSCMYYTGIDPITGEAIYVAKTVKDKKMQKALVHFRKPENKVLLKEALQEVGYSDLLSVFIGSEHKKTIIQKTSGRVKK